MKYLVQRWLAHVAALACAFLAINAAHAAPTAWVDFNSNGYSDAMRFDGGNVQCYSTDGVNCAWGTSAVNAAKDPAPKPLSCGAAHKAIWGSTGYDTPNHWCGLAYARLYATWASAASQGFDIAYSLNPNGDIECYGTNGRSCAWGGDAVPTSVNSAAPLACGAMHQSLYGVSGYTNVEHWCYKLYYATKKFTTLPAFNEGMFYRQGAVVESGGHTYRYCYTAGSAGTPYAHESCALGNEWGDLGWASGAAPVAPQWQAGAVYTKGDLVTYGGVLYISIYGMNTTTEVSSYTPTSSRGLGFWRAL